MATIEETIISPLQERAIDYCDKKQMPKIGRQIAVIAYMHGANEQLEIDIEKACEWLIQNAWCDGIEYRFDIDEFRKAMMEE